MGISRVHIVALASVALLAAPVATASAATSTDIARAKISRVSAPQLSIYKKPIRVVSKADAARVPIKDAGLKKFLGTFVTTAQGKGCYVGVALDSYRTDGWARGNVFGRQGCFSGHIGIFRKVNGTWRQYWAMQSYDTCANTVKRAIPRDFVDLCWKGSDLVPNPVR